MITKTFDIKATELGVVKLIQQVYHKVRGDGYSQYCNGTSFSIIVYKKFEWLLAP